MLQTKEQDKNPEEQLSESGDKQSPWKINQSNDSKDDARSWKKNGGTDREDIRNV